MSIADIFSKKKKKHKHKTVESKLKSLVKPEALSEEALKSLIKPEIVTAKSEAIMPEALGEEITKPETITPEEFKPKEVKLKMAKKEPVEKPAKKISRVYLHLEIPGFDELVSRGIERGSTILISGGPGAGKTIFGLHITYNASLKNEKCLYISFEETPQKLKHHMFDFGWEINDLEKKGLIKIVQYDPFKIGKIVEGLLMKSKGELKISDNELPSLFPPNFKPDIVIIDSLSALESAFVSVETSYRIYVEQLFRFLSSHEITSFLITENEHEMNKYAQGGFEEFLSDGVIILYNISTGMSERLNAIEILKLRGVKHEKKIVPFNITDKGIVIYPNEHIYLGGSV